MKPLRILVRKMLTGLELATVYLLGKIDIAYIVRYLRNPNPKLTVRILRAFGAQIGEGARFKRSIYVDNLYDDENSVKNFSFLSIGKDCYIGDSVFFDLSNKVHLEDKVVVSGKVSFVTHADCNRSPFLEKKFPRICEPITVCEGAWVGFGATVLAGVTIGNCSVVAAHSLVLGNTPSKTVYAGVPAVKLKDLDGGG